MLRVWIFTARKLQPHWPAKRDVLLGVAASVDLAAESPRSCLALSLMLTCDTAQPDKRQEIWEQ